MKKDFDLREVFGYINQTALFKNQWQLKTASQEDYARLVEEKFRPVLKNARTRWSPRAGTSRRSSTAISRARAKGMTRSSYSPSNPGKELLRFTFPRQREGRRLVHL